MYDSRWEAPHDLWLILSEVSVMEAALLIIGIEPQGVTQGLENMPDLSLPRGYLAARGAVVSAIQKGEIPGELVDLTFIDEHGGWETDRTRLDFGRSRVEMMPLRQWLHERGYRDTFLKLEPRGATGLRDPSNDRYSSKLAAVVAAWEEFADSIAKTGTVKQKLEIWLRKNAARFDLLDDEGKPRDTIIRRLAQVANWSTSGGAPKKSAGEPETDFLEDDFNDLDDL